jgi:hypothetical protein
MTGSALLALFGRVLTFCIPVPVVAIAAIAGWLWIDRTSAVRQAVDRATTELVAGGEIASLKAKLAVAEINRVAGDSADENFTRQLAVDQDEAAKDEENEHVAHDAQRAFSGRAWPIGQSDLDWLLK